MKKNILPLMLLTIALVVAFGLLFAGCGVNPTDAGLDAETQPDEQLLEARLAEVQAEQARLAQIADELETRKAEIAEPPAREQPASTIIVTVPTLTAFEIDLNEELSSESSLAGDPVSATLAQDVWINGLVTIAAGSEITGVVTEAVPSRKFGGQARLRLAFDRLIGPDGDETPIAATLEVAGKRQKKKDAATIAGSAAGGAVLGRILKDSDRDEGTALGAVLGGAIGAVVAAKNKNDPVELPAGTPLVVTLDAPLMLEIDAGA